MPKISHLSSDHHASEGIGKRGPRALVLVLEEHVARRRSSARAAARPSGGARPRRSPGGAGAGSPSPRSPRTASRIPPNRRCTARRRGACSTAYTSSASHDSCRNSNAARSAGGQRREEGLQEAHVLAQRRRAAETGSAPGDRRARPPGPPAARPRRRVGQPPHVGDAARALEREAERPRRLGRPALEQRRVRQPVEGAVDLDARPACPRRTRASRPGAASSGRSCRATRHRKTRWCPS